MKTFPYQLYGDDDPVYQETDMVSRYADALPNVETWMAFKKELKDDFTVQNPLYELYSENDPYYSSTETVSGYNDEMPNVQYWLDFQARIRSQEQPKEEKEIVPLEGEEKGYVPEPFVIGKQILMALGGSQEYMMQQEAIEMLTVVENESGIAYEKDKELEKYRPEVRRNDRFVPHHQDVTMQDMEPMSPQAMQYLNDENIIFGERLSDLNHSNFCDPERRERLFMKKELFRPITDHNFQAARNKANPYEKIGKAIFHLNRAATKMANIDFLYNLTNSYIFQKDSVSDVPGESPYFYFADICAGPGGFTEYMYWRLGAHRARGFGMTIKGSGLHDWAPSGSFLVNPDSFEKHYGANGTGNIMHLENINSFRDCIHRGTRGEMVSLVTADGGLENTNGEENAQEVVVKRLVVCQFLCALCILREGGNFVCKVFDLMTDFSASLVYLVAQCFERVSIVKPYTSRPANSERYIAFLGLREAEPDAVINHLVNINKLFQEIEDRQNDKNRTDDVMEDIVSIFPLREIPEYFQKYLTESNNELADKQIAGVDELLCYDMDRTMEPLDQKDVARRCLEEWCVPLNRDASYKSIYKPRAGTRFIRRERAKVAVPQLRQEPISEDAMKQRLLKQQQQDEEERRQREREREEERGMYSVLGNIFDDVMKQIGEDLRDEDLYATVPITPNAEVCQSDTFFRFWPDNL